MSASSPAAKQWFGDWPCIGIHPMFYYCFRYYVTYIFRELVDKKLDFKIPAHDIVRSHRLGWRGRTRRHCAMSSPLSPHTIQKMSLCETVANSRVPVCTLTRTWWGSAGKSLGKQLRREGKLRHMDGIILVQKTERNIKSFIAVNAWKLFKEQLWTQNALLKEHL